MTADSVGLVENEGGIGTTVWQRPHSGENTESRLQKGMTLHKTLKTLAKTHIKERKP